MNKIKFFKYIGVIISGILIGFLTWLEEEYQLVEIILDICLK